MLTLCTLDYVYLFRFISISIGGSKRAMGEARATLSCHILRARSLHGLFSLYPHSIETFAPVDD